MKLYLVWGVEYHGQDELFGVYDNMGDAIVRRFEIEDRNYGFDEIVIREVNLNEPLNDV